MFNVGDYVSRNSYKNDVVFKIISINEDIYYLKGVNVRLEADSYKDDLKLESNIPNDDFSPDFDTYKTLDRDEYFYLPGKVLHIDGDKEYLDKCMNYYHKNKGNEEE